MKSILKPILFLAVVLTAISCGSTRGTSSGSEQVDVGYGTTDKDQLTYAVSSMKMDEEGGAVYTNMYDYLRGRVPGVYVGPENTMSSIIVRGVGTVNGSTVPLVLVDGTEVNDLDVVMPYDVYSVSVLKDASSSIYGVRGANGVILITTKGAHQRQIDEEAAKKKEKEAKRAARAAERAKGKK
jgi:TonB-dependent SusC/RagA subfamily outer membrane receptor